MLLLLREFICQVLLEQQISDKDAEAPLGAELGRIAFAPKRPYKPFEANTDIEEQLFDSINDFISRNIPITTEQCQLIQKFLANGWYTPIFEAPKVKTIWRIMTVNEDWLRTTLNLQEDEDIPEIGIKRASFTFKSLRTVSSWTQDWDAMFSLMIPKKDYQVLITAKIADNPPNAFIACTKKLYGILGTWARAQHLQQEVIALIPTVNASKIQWRISSTHKWFIDDEIKDDY